MSWQSRPGAEAIFFREVFFAAAYLGDRQGCLHRLAALYEGSRFKEALEPTREVFPYDPWSTQ
jgi:hypothetical protein